MCERSRYSRAFSTAVPARRPSSSASSRSAWVKLRPDSALTKLSTPIARPAVAIGTSITARIPIDGDRRALLGVGDDGLQHCLVDPVDHLRDAVAQHLGDAVAARRRGVG